MRKLALAAFLLFSITSWAADKPAPNPADYTITVHVVTSHWDGCGTGQCLNVIIDAKKYTLADYIRSKVIGEMHLHSEPLQAPVCTQVEHS
jgi:hypothetical protein